jgi:hypothetical protein
MKWLKNVGKKRLLKYIINLSATAKSSEHNLAGLDYYHLENINAILAEINKRNCSLIWAFDALLPTMIDNVEITENIAKADPSNFVIILDQQIESLARNIATDVESAVKLKLPDGCNLAYNKLLSEIIRQIKLGKKKYEILSILNDRITEEPVIFIDGIIEWAKTQADIFFIALQPILKKSEPEGCSINKDWCKRELFTLLLAEKNPKNIVVKFSENVSKSFDMAYTGYGNALKSRESEAKYLWEQIKSEETSGYKQLASKVIIDESKIINLISVKLLHGEETSQIKDEIHIFFTKLIADLKDNKELLRSSFADQPIRSSSAGTIQKY